MLDLKDMKFSEIELPSNRNFGIFFTILFLAFAGYFFLFGPLTAAYILIFFSSFFFLAALFKSDILLIPNKLWMRFGILIGMIVSPIVLGFIFYGLFTPIAFFMRLNGRDELRLKFNNKVTHWILRKESIEPESFKKQF